MGVGWASDVAVGLRAAGLPYRLGPLLGEGSQGWVYRIDPEHPGDPALALKWYRPDAADDDQRQILEALATNESPSPAFLWPRQLITSADGFGYVMDVRPDRFRPVSDLISGRVDAPFSVVVRLCLDLSDAFLKLHAEGLCYRDISLGNVFADPTTGRPLICDTDNVGVDGQVRSRVLGTSRFMAPEIVRDEAVPSIATDLYSLAVLIFYLLMVHHPLVGRRELDHPCLDRAAEHDLFGNRPLFVFDPTDDSNRPDPQAHRAVLQYWPLYPTFLRADFERAFTVGLRQPHARVREGIWRQRMSRLLDGIVVCRCGAEVLTDRGEASVCWRCHQPLPDHVRLVVDDRPLPLSRATKLYGHHLRHDYDYDTVIGSVTAHPSKPSVWGLRNESGTAWRVALPSGSTISVPPGRAIGIIAGAEIDFGPTKGRIEA